jgi:four helix bundle protein
LPDVAGVKRFEELLAWQRMNELSVEVWRSTETGPAFRDFKFRDQIRDASDSAARNIAEGFGRFSPPQFAHFLDVSRGSAQETQALLRKGSATGPLTSTSGSTRWPFGESRRSPGFNAICAHRKRAAMRHVGIDETRSDRSAFGSFGVRVVRRSQLKVR